MTAILVHWIVENMVSILVGGGVMAYFVLALYMIVRGERRDLLKKQQQAETEAQDTQHDA